MIYEIFKIPGLILYEILEIIISYQMHESSSFQKILIQSNLIYLLEDLIYLFIIIGSHQITNISGKRGRIYRGEDRGEAGDERARFVESAVEWSRGVSESAERRKGEDMRVFEKSIIE